MVMLDKQYAGECVEKKNRKWVGYINSLKIHGTEQAVFTAATDNMAKDFEGCL